MHVVVVSQHPSLALTLGAHIRGCEAVPVHSIDDVPGAVRPDTIVLLDLADGDLGLTAARSLREVGLGHGIVVIGVSGVEDLPRVMGVDRPFATSQLAEAFRTVSTQVPTFSGGRRRSFASNAPPPPPSLPVDTPEDQTGADRLIDLRDDVEAESHELVDLTQTETPDDGPGDGSGTFGGPALPAVTDPVGPERLPAVIEQGSPTMEPLAPEQDDALALSFEIGPDEAVVAAPRTRSGRTKGRFRSKRRDSTVDPASGRRARKADADVDRRFESALAGGRELEAVRADFPILDDAPSCGELVIKEVMERISHEQAAIAFRNEDGSFAVVAGVGITPAQATRPIDASHQFLTAIEGVDEFLVITPTESVRSTLAGIPASSSETLSVAIVRRHGTDIDALLLVGHDGEGDAKQREELARIADESAAFLALAALVRRMQASAPDGVKPIQRTWMW